MSLLLFELAVGLRQTFCALSRNQSHYKVLKVSKRFARLSSTGNIMMGCFIDLIVLVNESIYTSYKSKARLVLRHDLSGLEKATILLVDRLLDPTEYSGTWEKRNVIRARSSGAVPDQ